MKHKRAWVLVLCLLVGSMGCASPAPVSEAPEAGSGAETEGAVQEDGQGAACAAETQQGTRTVETSPVLAKGFSKSLSHLMMVDEATAWAAGPGTAYRTTDGGLHWLAFRFGSEDGTSGDLYVQDADHAWVAEPVCGGGRHVTVWRTADGGQTWLAVELDVPTPVSEVAIDFDSEQDGWMLTSSGPAAGLMAKSLYHTNDGGESWQLVVCGCPGDAFVPTTEWMSGGMYTNGMAFKNASTGWVTGDYHGGNILKVYRTDSGGLRWREEKLPLPTIFQEVLYGEGMQPVFFGEERQEGVLPVLYRTREYSPVVFYGTKDGGGTWEILGEVDSHACRAPHGGECLVAVSDLDHFWVPSREAKLSLTRDGGRTWEEVKLEMPLVLLSFGSSTHGLGLAQGEEEQVIVRSTDGGRTWTPVPETASPLEPEPPIRLVPKPY